MEVLKDEFTSHKEMAIVERFGVFVDYTYPIAINIRRTHHVVRDMLITSMFEQANLFAQAHMRSGYTWVLKMDFSKYFASVDRATLHTEIRRKVSCRATLDLIAHIVPATGAGLPIGNLTSQLFANVYGHVWDRFITHKLKLSMWIRYMDDTVIFARSREVLAVIQHGLGWFAGQTLKMTFSKWSIRKCATGLPWLGYRVWPTHKLLLRASVVRAKHKLAKYQRLGLDDQRQRFLAAWTGHARWANSHNLLNHLGVSLP
jgi:RNA-directed DNA polymerase